VTSVTSITKAGAELSERKPTPRTPLTGSPIVKGLPKVAPEEKLRLTLSCAGSAIIL
jgi:hypothetical protein